jgi:hypothetical protein
LCTPRPLYAADPALESPLGEGFEVETVLNVRAAKGALRVWEVPSYELRRIHGASNLRALRDGLRVVRTIWGESPAMAARYSPAAAAPADAVAGTLPHPATIPAAGISLDVPDGLAQLARRGEATTGIGLALPEPRTREAPPLVDQRARNGHAPKEQ